VAAASLAKAADERTGCICYFGGDPATQVEHALTASRLAIERNRGRAPRICWETNGSMSRRRLREAATLSLATGGCVKFDLKAWNAGIHRGLCGADNRRTLANFAWLARLSRQRPEPPLLVASTLLVPGYVDAEEVGALAKFAARLDAGIPYSLLGFHPDFYMADLPRTSRRHAQACHEAALAAGLGRVRIGNPHVLGRDY
jgi:pyruvate formate lyase activating enzyme